jgi:hypothetical protein
MKLSGILLNCRPYSFGRLGSWLVCWADIATGFVGVITLGYIVPSWSFNLMSKLVLDKIKANRSKVL